MKTRNQFLQQLIKLAVSTFAVVILGIGLGNFMRNNETLLVKTNNIGMDKVSFITTDNAIVIPTRFNNPVKAVIGRNMYTQSVVSLNTEFPMGPEMNACFFEGRRLGEILIYNTKLTMPGVRKLQINRPPRGDTIDPNTS